MSRLLASYRFKRKEISNKNIFSNSYVSNMNSKNKITSSTKLEKLFYKWFGC